MRVITETEIVDARERVAAAEANGEQQDFEDALLASPDLEPDMVRQWLNATVNVRWCACESADDVPHIACPACGLPPYWTTRKAES